MSASETISPRDPRQPAMHHLTRQVGELEVLDEPAEKIAVAFFNALGPGRLKDAISGVFLGHPLHPLLTDMPIGTWTSATILDLFGGLDSQKAARRLIGAGILAAVPTAITGTSEWSDTAKTSASTRRVGLVHAAANVTALAFYSASWRKRRRGGRGRLSALLGLGALTVGGQLGGHLSYVEGVGVAQTTFQDGPEDWTPLLDESELEDGRPTCASIDGIDVLLVRQEGRVHALANRCTHRGGPLHNGELEDGCIVCPWHKSRFRLDDGSVDRGPAGSPQPAYATRVRDGRVEVRQATDPTP